ncbi:PQQ-dependent sugar dehydrogenase [Cellulomonas carbonis]|uniref:PQQ-dependent sugar dehydrogenase n=1 Tax=Cellulomonas carbonis TaxID=1386092 RepID=UPI000AE5AA6F|nr:PQQ-dependent sugar dehydrogenase [Cellulomonas carbonis]GGC13513.1 glycosyl hydrolase [Cellulomonas carbonis]
MAALGLALATAVALPQAATAHDGVDHGAEPGADAALDWSAYEKIELTKNVGEPISLAVMPDRTVLHTARNGDIRLTDPTTGVTRVINTIDVYANSEDGMQTITLDPDFEENGWVYLYYAPRVMEAPYPTTTPQGSAPNQLPAGEDESYWDQWKGYNQLTRVQWDPQARQLDMTTEQVILKVEVQRGQCCHVAGDVAFDADGNLYLSTGDNTPAGTPGANGFAPNNDAPGMNPGFDARRGAGSTNDLRGKILRITVQEDGSYTVPDGNLFEPGTEGTRPEIFAMGLRNPFRIDVDAETGAVMWGDYGPDSGTADPARGPMGYVEWMSTTDPLNGGWPYCHGPNANYNEWDFATATPGAWFDCEAGAENNSRWNTGLDVLPPATAPQLYYGDNPGDQPWDELVEFDPQGGQGPMGSPMYRYDETLDAAGKFPEYWDGKAFFYEFSQDYVAALTVPEPDGPVTHIEHFLPNAALRAQVQAITDSPIDMEFGPDGSLYVLDYGNGFFRQNPEAGLYRIDYAPGNKTPQAAVDADPISSSEAPLTVTLDGSRSVDPEGEELTYEWDLDGDGTFDATGAQVTHTYTELGQYTVRLRVTDPEGKFGITSRAVTVGNVAPTLTLDHPADGGFFGWGDAVPYRFSVSDPEDGTTPVCSRLSWTFGLGHDTHAHPEVLGSGCSGAWATPADAPEHGETEKLFGVVVANYTDAGNGDVPAAQGEVSIVLNPFVKEAEHADALAGVEVAEDTTAGALAKVTSLDAGDHLAFEPVNLAGIEGVEATLAGSGTLALRWGSPDAEPFGTVSVDGEDWQTLPVVLDQLPEGTSALYVTSTGGVEVDRFRFIGTGVTDVTAPVVDHSLTPAEPTGANGWYTEPVTLRVDATDDGQVASVEVSYDGGATWQSIRSWWSGAVNPVTLSEDGVHEVLYRAADNGGNVSEVGSVTVRIDTTAPEVTVTGVEDGVDAGSSATVDVAFSAQDATSGVAELTATLDGEAVEPGTLDLWTVALGEHVLVVTATDEAGNVTEQSVTFTVTTSFADLAAHVGRLAADGTLTQGESRQLSALLRQAERHADAGRTTQAVSALERFVGATDDELLVRDAQALAEQIG